MSRTETSRRDLAIAIMDQGRINRMGGILLHAAIAERLGLSPSDHMCADLLLVQSEPCTPGRLAALTGLSTGAITGVIDRLERSGFLVREQDPADRRRTFLRLTHAFGPELQTLFAPMKRGIEQLCENFTVAELAVVLRFMREIHVVTDTEAKRMRDLGAPPPAEAGARPRSRRPAERAAGRRTRARKRTAARSQ